jgi:hypothetical protein
MWAISKGRSGNIVDATGKVIATAANAVSHLTRICGLIPKDL